MVIADRFMDSTTVYQGIARKIDPEAVRYINKFAVGECLPDITFLLDLNGKTARERMSQRNQSHGMDDRMEQEPPEFYEKVRTGYLQLASAEPDRFYVVDAAMDIETMEDQIWRILRGKFHGVFEN
jgi:dTMP kinase